VPALTDDLHAQTAAAIPREIAHEHLENASPEIEEARFLIVAHVRRVNAALIAWDQWEANGLLPQDLRRPLALPPLDRQGLKELRRKLLRQLTALLDS
jgi:hypothetical protein